MMKRLFILFFCLMFMLGVYSFGASDKNHKLIFRSGYSMSMGYFGLEAKVSFFSLHVGTRSVSARTADLNLVGKRKNWNIAANFHFRKKGGSPYVSLGYATNVFSEFKNESWDRDLSWANAVVFLIGYRVVYTKVVNFRVGFGGYLSSWNKSWVRDSGKRKNYGVSFEMTFGLVLLKI